MPNREKWNGGNCKHSGNSFCIGERRISLTETLETHVCQDCGGFFSKTRVKRIFPPRF